MDTLIRNVTLIDPENRETRPRRSLHVRNGTIEAELDPGAEPPEAVDVIDGRGAYALPGMIDAHIHLRVLPHAGPKDKEPTPTLLPKGSRSIPLERYAARAQTFLYCGVTSLYDAGNDPNVIFSLREQERGGSLTIPRIHATGNLLTALGGHGHGAGIEISETGDVEATVAAHIAQDPDVVKITYDEHGWGIRPLVPILTRQTLARTIAAVHSHGKKVTVHVSHELRAREAVEAGADILAHPVIQSPMNQSFAEELAAAGIPIVSTLTIGDRYPRLADHPEYLDGPLYRDCEDEAERERLKTEEHAVQKQNRWADWMRTMTPVAQENLRMLVEAGAVVAAGTDQSFGPDYHRELELLAAAGIPEWDVLRAATCSAARALDRAGELGSFRSGAQADVLLLDADPTQDLAALRLLRSVIKGGVSIDRSALHLPVNERTSA